MSGPSGAASDAVCGNQARAPSKTASNKIWRFCEKHKVRS